ncbi:restriction endonuclease [Dysgonomonas capnocytophagoides]|uniref:restriction endonuclease n=1 Tax=Dysgonomonas capnocytophagoides TaxID=45254 RepID=UPI0004794674|nr:restriction endonuclease [Dysgonomonas capnocytophagoides]
MIKYDMIDFKELPEDGILFEQLIRELLVLEGFETHWTGVGQDGGRDLIVVEKLKGELSEYERKWLISCKHTANSGKSLGREQAGNITEDCRAIGAEGYILACSTQPTASLVTRLEEIALKQQIITRFWDSIELENKLLKPNTFKLIHTFFPKSAVNYQWKIYNAFSPAFWAANYKDYFFYLSSRHSNTYPYLESIETIVSLIEKIPIYKDKNDWWNSHYLRLRSVYYDDKHCTHIAYIDYIIPHKADKSTIIAPKQLQKLLFDSFTEEEHKIMNLPDWDILYIEDSTVSDSFQLDHKRYYEPFIKEFEKGMARK